MKIRIFALARDLGLDSKVLIDLCEEAGVKLRNALATISEEERDQVVAAPVHYYTRTRRASHARPIMRTQPLQTRHLNTVHFNFKNSLT